jgi:hypothetical protein
MRDRRRLLGLLSAAAISVAVAVVPGSAAHASTSYYTMQLSSTSATVQPGDGTRTIVSFRASRYLYDTLVDLSVSGLPDGVTASFTPQPARIGGASTLTLTTASTSPAGAFPVTVIAITEGTDPIGTSTTFGLTINAP